MNDSQDRLEWFKNTYRNFAQDLTGVTDWQYLRSAAIYRKLTGDLDGAIEAMAKAIGMMAADPRLIRETAISLNYLADLYITKSALDPAEETILKAVALSRSHHSTLLGDNLMILANVQRLKGDYRIALNTAEEARQVYKDQGHAHGVALTEELIRKISDQRSPSLG